MHSFEGSLLSKEKDAENHWSWLDFPDTARLAYAIIQQAATEYFDVKARFGIYYNVEKYPEYIHRKTKTGVYVVSLRDCRTKDAAKPHVELQDGSAIKTAAALSGMSVNEYLASRDAWYRETEILDFFQSQWYEQLTNIDSDWLIKSLNRKAESMILTHDVSKIKGSSRYYVYATADETKTPLSKAYAKKSYALSRAAELNGLSKSDYMKTRRREYRKADMDENDI